jgi:hypothetical protein
MHQLNWTPGQFGKSLFTNDGVLHTWNTDRPDGPDGEPTHRQYIINHLGYDPYHQKSFDQVLDSYKGVADHAFGFIYPNGYLLKHNRFNDNATWKQHTAIDPRLWTNDDYDHQPPDPYDFHFPTARVAEAFPGYDSPGFENHMDDDQWSAMMADRMAEGLAMRPEVIQNRVAQGWQKGTRGKGYTGPDGRAVEWSVDASDAPHHGQVQQTLGHQDRDSFHIMPDGRRISDADYLAGAYPDLADDWDFATL